MAKKQPTWAKEIAQWCESDNQLNRLPTLKTSRICMDTLREIYGRVTTAKERQAAGEQRNGDTIPDPRILWEEETKTTHPSNEEIDSIRMNVVMRIFHPHTLELLMRYSRHLSNGKPGSGTRPLDIIEKKEISSLVLQLRSIGNNQLSDLICSKFAIVESQIERWSVGVDDAFHCEAVFDDEFDEEEVLEEEPEEKKPKKKKKEEEEEEEEGEMQEATPEEKAAIGIRTDGIGLVEEYTDKNGEPIYLQGSCNFAEGVELLLRMKRGNALIDRWCWKNAKHKTDGEVIRLLQAGASIGSHIDEDVVLSDATIAEMIGSEDQIDAITIPQLMGDTVREANALEAVDIWTLGDLKDLTVADLAIKGMRAVHNAEKSEMVISIRAMLARVGRTLPDGDLDAAKEVVALRAVQRKEKKAVKLNEEAAKSKKKAVKKKATKKAVKKKTAKKK
jgi:hypothetical protein